MNLTFTITTTLALSAVVFAVRHRELKTLAHDMSSHRKQSGTLAATQITGQAAAESKSILDALRSFSSGEKHEEADLMALRTRMSRLSADELRALCVTARQQSSNPPEFLAVVARWAVSALADQDNAFAADLLAGMPQDNPLIARELAHFLKGWMEKDPGTVLAWIEQAFASGTLGDSPQRSDFERLMACAAVMHAPVTQLQKIRSLPEEEQTELVARGLFRLKSAEDTRAFASAVITWPTAKVRDMAIGAMMDKLLEYGGFDAAAAWLDDLLDANEEEKARARFALMMREPESAAMPRRAAWIMSHTDTAGHEEIAVRITKDWLWHDFNAAGAWLHANRTAPWFDAAAGAFAGGIASKDPTTAFEWALTVSDPVTRRASLTDVMRRWRRNKPSEAEEYLRASLLPEEWKAELSNEATPKSPPPE